MTLTFLYGFTGAAAALLVDRTLGLVRRQAGEKRMASLAEVAAAHPVEMCPCEDCRAAMAGLAEYSRAANAGEPDR